MYVCKNCNKGKNIVREVSSVQEPYVRTATRERKSALIRKVSLNSQLPFERGSTVLFGATGHLWLFC